MDFHQQVEDQKIRDETMEWLIALLTRNATDPERIGRRVLYFQFILERKKGFPKMLTLAEKLGVSASRASQAVSALYDEMEDWRNVNFPVRQKEKE